MVEALGQFGFGGAKTVSFDKDSFDESNVAYSEVLYIRNAGTLGSFVLNTLDQTVTLVIQGAMDADFTQTVAAFDLATLSNVAHDGTAGSAFAAVKAPFIRLKVTAAGEVTTGALTVVLSTEGK